jgi:hypothetical protein
MLLLTSSGRITNRNQRWNMDSADGYSQLIKPSVGNEDASVGQPNCADHILKLVLWSVVMTSG